MGIAMAFELEEKDIKLCLRRTLVLLNLCSAVIKPLFASGFVFC